MKRRTLWAALLCTSALFTPTWAHADAATGVRVGTLIAAVALSFVPGVGPLLSALVTAAGNVAAQALTKVPGPQQREARTTSFDVHPNFRFPFGEFPQGGRVVMHHVEGAVYYLVYLLSSTPIHGLTKIEMADGVELDIPGIEGVTENADYNGVAVAQNIEDMDVGAGAQGPDPYGVSDEPDIKFWLGKGDHTQPPQQWLDEIPDVISATDIWSGCGVLFVRLVDDNPTLSPDRYGTGRPPPFRIYMRGAKVYDPRRDSTSGVTGASGSHRIDDPTTWQYFDDDGNEIGANPALAWLMIATHTYALGFDQEMIPIQQIADAADACDELGLTVGQSLAITNPGGEDGTTGWTTSGGFTTRSVDPAPYAGDAYFFGGVNTASSSAYQDIDVSGYATAIDGGSATFTVTWQQGRFPAHSDQGNITLTFYDGDGVEVGSDAGPGLSAVNAWTERTTGAVSVPATTRTVRITMVAVRGTGSNCDADFDAITATLGGQRAKFRVDGLVTIQQRDFSLFADILAACAGSLDTTDGLLGLRVGVWEAPTHTMSQPISDEISIDGARDSGYDKVVAKYIAKHKNYEENDGPGWDIRDTGSRTLTLDLPLVREDEQAARLEKIAAGQMEPDRTVTAVWDGRESMRRVGERVNFALTGWARGDAIYRVDSIQPVYSDGGSERGNGLANERRITLVEDEEATYDFTSSDYTQPDDADLPTVTPPSVTAPTAVAAEQSDHYSGGAAVPRLKVTVTNTSTAGDVRIEYQAGGGSWTHLAIRTGATTVTAYLDPAVVGVTYIARARRENSAVGVSDWVESDPVTIVAPVLDYDHADYSAEYT